MWKYGPENAGHCRPFKPGAALLAVLILAGASFGQDKKEPTFLSISKAFKLSGWTQFQYVGWDKGVDSFSIRRSRLTLAGDILKNMHYKLQVDFAKTPTLLDAIIEYEFSQAFQLRVGQFLVPFSLENLMKLSEAYDVPVSYFFQEPERVVAAKPAEGWMSASKWEESFKGAVSGEGVQEELLNPPSEHKKVKVTGAVVGQAALDADGVQRLATLPGREVLLAQLGGAFSAPATHLAGLFAASLRNLGYALAQLGERGAASGA